MRGHESVPSASADGSRTNRAVDSVLPQPPAVRLSLTVTLPSFTITRRGSASPLILCSDCPGVSTIRVSEWDHEAASSQRKLPVPFADANGTDSKSKTA